MEHERMRTKENKMDLLFLMFTVFLLERVRKVATDASKRISGLSSKFAFADVRLSELTATANLFSR
jgi:hypothetical protein